MAWPAALEGQALAFELPGEVRPPEQLVSGDAGHRDGDHRRHGDGVVARELEQDEDGGYGRAEHRCRHRTHADNSVEAVVGGELGKDVGGNNAEGAAGHGAEEERRAEHAAAEARTQRGRGRHRFGDDEGDEQPQRKLLIECGVGGLVADAENLGKEDRDGTHDEPADGRKVAEVHARDEGAGDRGDDDRCEGTQCVVADHHLEGKEHAGDGRVERGRDSRCDAAAEQRDRERGWEVEAFGDERGRGGAEVDHGPLAPGRAADPERGGVDRCRAQALAQRHTPAAVGARRNDVGDAERPAARHRVVNKETDEEPAGGRRKQHLPPGEGAREGEDVVRGEAVEGALDPTDGDAKTDRSESHDDADQHRKGGQDDLFVARHTPPGDGLAPAREKCHGAGAPAARAGPPGLGVNRR